MSASAPGLDDAALAELVRNRRYRLSQVDGILAAAPAGTLTEADEPVTGARAVARALGRLLLEVVVLPFLRLNERLIRRQCDPRAIVARDEVPFLDELEAAWPAIREEIDAVFADDDAAAVPPTRTFVPDLAQAEDIIGGRGGSWHGFALIDPKGWWIDFNAERCPRTCEVLRRLPGLQTAMFSVFAPHTVLPPHQGPNKGQLTIHLGVIVPEPPGSCAIQVGEETARFEEGVAWAFDDTQTHTTWNEGEGPRVSLLVQVARPLPWPASWTNRVAQPLFKIYSYPRGGWGRLLRDAGAGSDAGA
ncbi:MAG: aspartyl/asparaginyl beta-hydroxylase domain-containing protein [Acidimicrobiales bacterium]|nr:aspartyl/asparaginyl beta-hydroxylase domain-containing protein [Acidimicrobiales bacterium]MCB9373949.1 aspartyl/asparaginyl beta-hydroxylase domain-containing protein [Microthrixaceae bacterium]